MAAMSRLRALYPLCAKRLRLIILCHPLPYCHVDLAGSVADAPCVETGPPIVPLIGHFLMGISAVP